MVESQDFEMIEIGLKDENTGKVENLQLPVYGEYFDSTSKIVYFLIVLPTREFKLVPHTSILYPDLLEVESESENLDEKSETKDISEVDSEQS